LADQGVDSFELAHGIHPKPKTKYTSHKPPKTQNQVHVTQATQNPKPSTRHTSHSKPKTKYASYGPTQNQYKPHEPTQNFPLPVSNLRSRLSILFFFQFFIWGTWVITLGTYMLESLNFSGRQVGMVYATNAIAATLSPVIMGVLADKLFASNRLMIILHFMGGCCLLGAFYSTEFGQFYGWMLGFNLCYVPTFNLCTSLSFHHLKEPKQDFPIIRVWGTIAWIVTSVMLSYFAMEDRATPLLIGAIGSFILTLYNFTLPHTPPQPGLNLAALRSPEFQALVKDRSLIVLVVATLLICFSSTFYYSFVNPFLNEVGVSNAAAKMSIGQVFEILVVLSMPWVFRKLPLRTILFWGFVAWGTRYFAFAFGRPEDWSMSLIYLGIAVQGIAFSWVQLAAQLYVDSRVPNYLRATAQGIVTFANYGVGAFIGSMLAGEIVSRYASDAGGQHDWTTIFLFPAVAGCFVALGFWWFFPKRSSGEAQSGKVAVGSDQVA
jgi:nucleoside transporter